MRQYCDPSEHSAIIKRLQSLPPLHEHDYSHPAHKHPAHGHLTRSQLDRDMSRWLDGPAESQSIDGPLHPRKGMIYRMLMEE